ncbi:MAG: hypothetical protein HXX14_04885 [Bacteroidetes bacterium]|nr:hypothetical protein [Bacteroidota bacterium]
MRLFKTLKRMFRILFVPLKEWQGIAVDSEPLGTIIKYYAWPLIVLSAIVKVVSIYLDFTNDSNLTQFKVPFIFTMLFFNLLAPIFVILLGGVMIGKIGRSMGATTHPQSSSRLLIYSYTPLFFATILINTGLNSQYLGLISIYSIVLFWLGIEPMLQLPSDRKLGFLILSIMILCFLFFVVTLFIRLAINLLYPEGVVLFL